MNIEEAKELVGSRKIVVLDELATAHLSFVNYKRWCVVYKCTGDVFVLQDYFTTNKLGWFTPNLFDLLEYEYIDDYKQAIKESFDGKYVQALQKCGIWEDLTYFSLQELKVCDKFRVQYN